MTEITSAVLPTLPLVLVSTNALMTIRKLTISPASTAERKDTGKQSLANILKGKTSAKNQWASEKTTDLTTSNEEAEATEALSKEATSDEVVAEAMTIDLSTTTTEEEVSVSLMKDLLAPTFLQSNPSTISTTIEVSLRRKIDTGETTEVLIDRMIDSLATTKDPSAGKDLNSRTHETVMMMTATSQEATVDTHEVVDTISLTTNEVLATINKGK